MIFSETANISVSSSEVSYVLVLAQHSMIAFTKNSIAFLVSVHLLGDWISFLECFSQNVTFSVPNKTSL